MPTAGLCCASLSSPQRTPETPFKTLPMRRPPCHRPRDDRLRKIKAKYDPHNVFRHSAATSPTPKASDVTGTLVVQR
ncbi:BBE domain-containing protein [Streptomyces milbemycinicus]|uniref:BBE domain-containing protein n=2 Tax=Streptomyces TaxID=1883 RepID=UPI0009970C65